MNDIDTLLSAHDPGADTPDYSNAERSEFLTNAIAPPLPSLHGRGWRIGAVAAAVVTVVSLGLGNLAGTTATARAEEILTEAAINAVDPPTKPGQYWKVTATGDYGNGDACSELFVDTSYLSVDGSRPSWYIESYDEVPGCPPVAQGRTWTLTKSPNEMIDNWRWPSPNFFASLPRDVEQLRARLYTDAEDTDAEGASPSSTDVGVVALVDYALTYGAPPADLRSAMFEVLKTVPGIAVVDEMVMDGRNVAIFTLEGREVTEMMMIDPEAGNLVGFQGVENQRKVTYDREVVDEVPEEIRAGAEVMDCEIGFTETGDFAGDLLCG